MTGTYTNTVYIYVTASGTGVTMWSDKIDFTVNCGLNSVTALADPVSGTTQTKDAGGTNAWFDITSVSNSKYSSCPPISWQYVDQGTFTPATATWVCAATTCAASLDGDGHWHAVP